MENYKVGRAGKLKGRESHRRESFQAIRDSGIFITDSLKVCFELLFN